MDDSRAWIGKGGTVEPGDRTAVAKATFQTPDPAEGPRFELRDATTDLIYNAKSFNDMVVKADRVGALRFTAIDVQGQRSFVHKVDGLGSVHPGSKRNRHASPKRLCSTRRTHECPGKGLRWCH